MKCTTVPSIKRWLLTMLLLAIVNGLHAWSHQVIRIGFKDVKLIQTLERIEKATSFKFIYNREDIDASKRVNIQEKDWLVTELLEEVSRQASFSYKIVDGIVALAPKTAATDMVTNDLLAKDVKGKVTDKNGQALPGASVKVKGKMGGTATGANGSFSIQAEPSDILVISFTGFVTQEVAAGSGDLNIMLEEDTRGLNEIVVTALGIRKKENRSATPLLK